MGPNQVVRCKLHRLKARGERLKPRPTFVLRLGREVGIEISRFSIMGVRFRKGLHQEISNCLISRTKEAKVPCFGEESVHFQVRRQG